MGVAPEAFQVPCRSGSPHGVRGTAVDCAPAAAVNSAIAAAAPSRVRFKAFMIDPEAGLKTRNDV